MIVDYSILALPRDNSIKGDPIIEIASGIPVTIFIAQ